MQRCVLAINDCILVIVEKRFSKVMALRSICQYFKPEQVASGRCSVQSKKQFLSKTMPL